MRINHLILNILLGSIVFCATGIQAFAQSVIPVPLKAEQKEGIFRITETTQLYTNLKGEERRTLEDYLTTLSRPFNIGINEEEDIRENVIILRKVKVAGHSTLKYPESYSLKVTPHQILIQASTDAGLFYGLQTLIQLTESAGTAGWTVQSTYIEDAPRFDYRGFMMDVSRHFRSKEFVKKQIDVLARYKLNRLHLHLADGAGWRIEIKKYPRLTEFAAWRPQATWKEWWFGENNRKYCEQNDPRAHGGFFTQDDIRELLKYAAERHIVIIPEIEMPAHSEEVLAAYPELSCAGEPYKNDDFCVGNEQTFTFLEEVLTEIMELFPSEYIHVGGDEAGKRAWKTCPKCQQRMKENNLKDVNELQSYLIHRIEVFLNAHGRKLLGWDEIMEGGLAPNATVMSWRGEEGGLNAVRMGHRAIMTPGDYCYLDKYQDAPFSQPEAIGGYLPLSQIYSYNPVPEALTSDEAKLIYGVQANLWAEYIPTDEYYEYMLYPRLLALAEVAWSAPQRKSYPDFHKRALSAVEWLRKQGYHPFDLKNEIGHRPEATHPIRHLAFGKSVKYNAPYNASYSAQGDKTLTDGIRGDWTYSDGAWQGFISRNRLDVTIDLETETEINSISADFMQMVGPEVFLPVEVIISVSSDGTDFTELARITHEIVKSDTIERMGWQGDTCARYVRVQAHAGKEFGGWIFTDEIVVEANPEVRTEYTFEKGWKFTREDNIGKFSGKEYDDTRWQSVTVPHDWAIYGPFSVNNDKQKVAITQDGQKEALEHAGRTGGLPFVGVGWYRLKFDVPDFSAGKTATLIFDGAMSHARIYINGQEVGYWPYGYNSFYLDVTPYLRPDENILAVRLENETESSRWYPGAGLYRNVHLVINEDAHIPVWGTQLTTPVIDKGYAKVNLKTSLVVPAGKAFTDYRIVTELKDASGKVVATGEKPGTKYDNEVFEQELLVDNPSLWSPDSPVLYSAVSRIYEGNQLKDKYITSFGIRSIEIIPDKGFYLNGQRLAFKGVCNHHDLGPLGGIANEAGIRRQIRILRNMGCNAIRTSHNMPAPELIRACDELGMMVMAESFDEWESAKVQNGYHKIFDEWAEKDLVNLVRHFRNNPSVVMWCIGNEVPDQWNGNRGPKLSRFLQDICHREDPTRPVTQGMDAPDAVVNNNMAAVMDVPGFNYRPHKYQENYKKLPQQIILGSETASTLSSRGVYKLPVVRRAMQKYDDHQSSSYDVEHCSWSNLPEDDFIQHEDLPYCIGEFVWTGFDYLGEPTPYYTDWPSHSSLFGIVDLAGLPKDRYYLYRSHWNKEEETLHILPHWNWEGHEGEVVPIFVYTNYPSAELFINGKSQGRRTKDLSVTIENSSDSASTVDLKRQQRYRLMWMDTKYEPGVVKVIAYDKEGKRMAEKEMYTAGKPHHIELIPDRSQIKADGKDLSFITVRVVDKDGNLCPLAENEISFRVKGAGTYQAGANGNPASLESFQVPKMKVFSGMMTAIVSSTDKPGRITLEATGKGLVKGILNIESK